MLPPVISNMLYAMSFVVVGAFIGICFILCSVRFIGPMVDKLTPNIDEDKEIIRGNVAVAEYSGRIISAVIVGISLVVSAAVLAGVLAGLHG